MTAITDRPHDEVTDRPPQLTMRYRRKHPEEHSVMLGRAQYGFPVRLPCEEHAVFIAPPRTYKSALLAKIILRYKGPVLSTTTRADLYRNTYRARLRLGGRNHVFNPQGIGKVPSTFAWDVIEGCQDISTAIRRADAFAYAISSAGMEDGAFWSSRTSAILRAFFYGAAWARAQGTNFGLADVARWALTDRSEQAEEILRDAGAKHWSEEVGQLRGEARKTAETIRMYLGTALQFMADPSLASAVTPRPGEPPFDLQRFATSTDTLYMIAQGQDEHSPMAGLFACLANEVHYTAGMVGSYTDTGRLPRPMLLGLDEVCQICPVPVATWMADSGGKGIQIIAVGHGEAQFRKKFGTHSARQIFDCAGLLAVLPGVTDPETLRSISQSCGSIQMRHHGGDSYSSVPVMDEAMVRQLTRGHALLLRNNLSPVIIRAGRVWDDKLYKVLKREPAPQPSRWIPPVIALPDDAAEPAEAPGEAA